ncbi:MAG: DinB family protein [Bacteroidota bacterium]
MQNNIETSTNRLIDLMSEKEYNYAMTFYTDKAADGRTLEEVFNNTTTIMENFIDSIPTDQISYRYAHGKWTIGEVLQHIISYEYIMTERALVIAGKAPVQLKYQYYSQATTVSGATGKNKAQLLQYFRTARQHTIAAFAKLAPNDLIKVGILDGNRASVRAIGLCISGHQAHHFRVLEDRYL